MEKQKSNKSKFNLSGITALILAILLVVIALPINLIVQYYDFRIDATPSKLYTLTETSTKLLDSVKDKPIEMYVMASNVTEIEDFSSDDMALPLYYALKQYDEYENIKITCFDPDKNPDLATELNPNGYYNLSGGGIILVKCGDFVHKVTNLFVDNYDANGNVTAQKYVGENLIAGAIETVTAGETATIYFLTGHGEKTIEDSYNLFKANAKNANYDFEELNLSSVDAVPENAGIVFICAPQEDISLSEKEKLMEYAENGGNLSFFMSPNEGEFRYSNIEDILADYDLGMDYNLVYETNSYMHIPDDPNTVYITLPDATEEMSVDLTGSINSNIYDSASGLLPYMSASRSFYTVVGDNHSVLETASIMQTSEYTDSDGGTSYTSSSEPFGGTEIDPDILSGQLNLAYYSYNKQNGSKLTVFGNADFFDDEHVSSEYTIVPLYLCLSTISWMYDSDTNMNISDKDRSYDYMEFENEKQADNTLKLFTIAPFVVAAIGLLVWWRRRNS